jgi:hypothetical protein
MVTRRIGYALIANGHFLFCKKLLDTNVGVRHHLALLLATQGKKMSEIDPNKAINYITANAEIFAKAKADRIFVENNLRVVKSELVGDEEGTQGAKDAYAYSHPRYKAQLEALREATKIEEELLWMMKAAFARIDVWKTAEYGKRAELRTLG